MGKISKPQKSSKNKKIKSIDPFYVGDRPADRHQDKYNLKPKGTDEWENSRSIQDIVRLKNEAKTSGAKYRRKNKNKFRAHDAEGILDNLRDNEKGVTRPVPHVPDFKQRRGESETKFMWRVDRETRAVINKAHFEDKFHIGEDPSLFKSKSEKKKGENLPSSTKQKDRLKEKKRKIKEKRTNKVADCHGGFSALQDKVMFGEVVQQPPTLTFKPRKSNHIENTSKIGSKKLLLHSLLDNKLEESDDDDVAPSNKKQSGREVRQIGKTIKRKKLSPGEQRLMDNEREKVIEMYRKLKQKQISLQPNDT